MTITKWKTRGLMTLKYFTQLEIETSSYCNRSCPTCIRNSHPDRAIVKPWFVMNEMPMKDILGIVQGMHDLGFRGSVNLSRFNEPLLDTRLPEIAKEIKKIAPFGLMLHSNSDALTEELAVELDGLFDKAVFSLYDDDAEEREQWIRKLFHDTTLLFVNKHIVTHYYPEQRDLELAEKRKLYPCNEPGERILFNHKGELVFCCEEITNEHFHLGSFPEQSIEELLSNEYLYYCIGALEEDGGRQEFPFCSSCPKLGKVIHSTRRRPSF
jgi:hypothetical protein